jgi:hypothetical protein
MLLGSLAMGRAQAESRMTETITAGPFVETIDPSTLATVRTITTTSYTGPARVKYPTLTVSERDSGGQQYAAVDIVVSVPMSGARIPVGALVTVTASTVDGSLVAREFRVKASAQSGQVTAHRYPVEELS